MPNIATIEVWWPSPDSPVSDSGGCHQTHSSLAQQSAGNGGNGWHTPLIQSQPILHACSCWKKHSLPGKRINFALKYFFLYLTRSTATPALTPVIPKCLPWVGVFNEGFLSRPAFCQVQFICHVASFSLHPYYIYKLFSFRRVPRTLKLINKLHTQNLKYRSSNKEKLTSTKTGDQQRKGP